MTRHRGGSRSERGQVAVFFALLLPVLFGLTAMVLAIGNWYTHGKHLQTKADASVFAGGDGWTFPCEPAIDASIETAARTYVGPHMKADGTPYVGTTFNEQVGGVGGSKIHAVLNGSAFYDDDSNPAPLEKNDPAGPICAARILDVRATEDNSFPLASVLPFFPDIKRKARLEIQEGEEFQGVLPIAVRAPEPVSIAAVFYDEQTGAILRVKYFVKKPGIFGLPGGLQGWSTENSEDPNTWARFPPPAATGVVVALSFRGACNTNLPNPNTKIATQPAPCFEDEVSPNTVTRLCNQGASAQIVNCFWATGAWPTDTVRSGLHFIRGWADENPGVGPPAVETAHLENVSCPTNAYFSTHPTAACRAKLSLEVDVGNLQGTYPNPTPPPATITDNLRAGDVQVRYRLVRSNGSSSCDYGAQCDLIRTGAGPGNMTFSTQGSAGSPHLPFTANSQGNAVAIEIQLRNAVNHANPNCRGTGFNPNCRWFYTGNGLFGASVPPTDAQILAAPIQRGFRGNTVSAGSAKWLRLTQDRNCDGTGVLLDPLAASAQIGGNRCFFVELGLKGGLAQDADEEPILFNDGVGSSQMGAVDCDPNIQQGQILIAGVQNGCGPWYAVNEFDTTPLCPLAANIYLTPNPGPPWDDWPPLECIKTRPTSQMNQLQRGLNLRFFGDENANSCPTDDASKPVDGRNYWDRDTNAYDGASFRDDDPAATPNNLRDDDPRLVTIFLSTADAFVGSGQNTFPISGFISIYITGYGAILGSGSIRIDDPCPGSALPTDLDLSGGVTGGYAIWGHILKHVLSAPGTRPSGRICDPLNVTPCVPVLVE